MNLNKIFLLLCLFLAACTSDQGKVKKLSIAEGEKVLLEMLKKEAVDFGPESRWLRNTYIEYMLRQSEVQVSSLTFPTASAAVVVVDVNTYSWALRKALLGIAEKADPQKERNFNYGQAVVLIAQNDYLSREKVVQPLKTLRYTKRDKDWFLEE